MYGRDSDGDGCAGKEEERSFGKLCDVVGPTHNVHDFVIIYGAPANDNRLGPIDGRRLIYTHDHLHEG